MKKVNSAKVGRVVLLLDAQRHRQCCSMKCNVGGMEKNAQHDA